MCGFELQTPEALKKGRTGRQSCPDSACWRRPSAASGAPTQLPWDISATSPLVHPARWVLPELETQPCPPSVHGPAEWMPSRNCEA